MRIEGRVSGNVRIMRLAGDFDIPEARELARSLDAAASAGAVRLVLNLEKLRFAGAATIGCLVEARAKARKRAGDLVVSGPSKSVRRVLRTIGLDRSFRVFPDDAAAIRHFGGRRPQQPTTERTLATG